MVDTMSRDQKGLKDEADRKAKIDTPPDGGAFLKPDNDSGTASVALLGPEAKRQWTLKGIPPSAVELSREAAKRHGMKLNTWVSTALENAAQNDFYHRAGGSDPQSYTEISNRLNELEDTFKDEQRRVFRKCIELEDLVRDVYTHILRNRVRPSDNDT